MKSVPLMQNLQSIYLIEEARTKIILGSKCLRFFNRDIEFWQIGMILHRSAPHGINGVNHLIRQIENRRLSEATIFSFLKDATALGYLDKQIGDKKNRYVVRLAGEAISGFDQLFAQTMKILEDART
jgi:hypothetical protein